MKEKFTIKIMEKMVFLIIGVIIVGGIALLIAGCNSTNKGQIIGGDKDDHGCLIGAGYSWCDSLQKCIRPWEVNCTKADAPIVGNDRDSHGCIGSAGYSWCEAKQKCIRVWEENCTTESVCTCPEGYVQEGEACNPDCYYSTPKCLMPSIKCTVQEKVCGDCPVYSPPAPGWCSDGNIVASEKDSCGCTPPPKCVKTETLTKNYCTPEQKKATMCTMEYHAVCGWFSQNIKCFKYPCAVNAGNPCGACATENVEYWTEGECPK